jgi:allophanate hydrolase
MTVSKSALTPNGTDVPSKVTIFDPAIPKKEMSSTKLPGHITIPAQPYAFTFHPAKTALVIIDMQRDFLLKGGFGDLQSASQLAAVQQIIPNTLSVLQAFRKAGARVIHTREGHEPHLLDCPPPKLTRQKGSPTSTRHTLVIGQKGPMGRLLVRGEYGHDIVDELQPLPGELVIDKPGKGAFYNTAFQEKLIAMGITHLFVCGVTVECCVTTTAREGIVPMTFELSIANDRGFEVCTLSDCVDGYVPSFKPSSLDMLHFSDGLFGWVADSQSLVDELSKVAAATPKPKAWDGALDISSLTSAYATKTLTPSKLVDILYARIEEYSKVDPAVFITLFSKKDLLARAAKLEAKYTDTPLPPLYGIPVTVKDSIDIAGVLTTAACPAYAYTPTKNATTITQLLDLGVILLGKVNLDQLATGLIGSRSPYGAPHSVFSKDHVSGGSSSGSAVSVGAHLCSFSLATDTAGSGRVPPSFNNIVGYKPTRGCLSTVGVVPACKSFDCIAIQALTVSDARKVWDLLNVPDPEEHVGRLWRGEFKPAHLIYSSNPEFRFIIPPEEHLTLITPGYRAMFDEAIEQVKAIGGKLVQADYSPFANAGKLLYEGSFVAARVSGVGREWLDKHKDDLLPPTREIYMNACKFTAVDAFNDLDLLAQCSLAARREFEKFDILLVPATTMHPTHAEIASDPIAINHKLGKFTHYGNLLDMCGITVPAGFDNSLPFGVTFLGGSMSDGLILEAARMFQEKTGIKPGI